MTVPSMHSPISLASLALLSLNVSSAATTQADVGAGLLHPQMALPVSIAGHQSVCWPQHRQI